MLDLLRAKAGVFSWAALFLALGGLFTVIGQGAGMPAIIAAVGVLLQALTPAVINWITPKPDPKPPASSGYWLALALLIGLSGSAYAQCPGGSCPRPPASFVVRPAARVYAPRPVAPVAPPSYASDPAGHYYRWVLYSDGFYRLVMIR